MTEKSNDSTRNRPEGARVLDAAIVNMELFQRIRQIRSEKAWETNDRNAITLLHNDRMRIVLIAVHAQKDIPEHTVDGPCSIQLIEGRIWLQTPEQSQSLDAGDLIALAAQVPHSVHAEEESILLLTMASSDQQTF